MNRKKRLNFILFILISVTGTLLGMEDKNIVFAPQKGTWTHSGTVVPAGEIGTGDLIWSGTRLNFIPKNGTCSLEEAKTFSFMLRVPETMRKQKFKLTFVYQDGGRKHWNYTTPKHIGWQRFIISPLVKNKQSIRKDAIKEILFTAARSDFHAFLRDVRLISGAIDHSFPEDRVQPVTNGCFFPENTLDSTKKEILSDPEFKSKMKEIERLRRSKLKVKLNRMQKNPSELAISLYNRIHPDGSFEGLSYEDVVKKHQETKYLMSTNQNYIFEHIPVINKLLWHWRGGRVPRTPENRTKLIRLMIRIMSAEYNQKGDTSRYVVCSFLLPQMAVLAYSIFFDEMEAVENGSCHDPEIVQLNRLLKEVASWCYMEPADRPTAPCLTVNSFRFHSAWTGGNFSYRPTYQAALVCKNPRMLDVISEVAEGCLNIVSWSTKENAFWLDGMTADGSAWGHNEQNYPFRYPLDGFLGIGRLIGNLSGSRWKVKPDGSSFNHFCNYMEALTWYGTSCADATYQKKAAVPRLLQLDIPTACGRFGMQYNPGRGYEDFAKAVQTLEKFRSQLPEGSPQKTRLDVAYDVMTGEKPLPVGTRYFWNNDLLLCREKDSILAVAMLSSRVLSAESAPSASHYIDFWNDGAAWIMKHFDSYRVARGFFHPCAIPGVTARQFDYEHTGNRWHIYRGGYNFAGGATDGNYAVCGFRMGRDRKQSFASNPDPRFYNLIARKSYFWLNGTLVCLGCDINEQDQNSGAAAMNIPIATTVDQTLWRNSVFFGHDEIRKPGEKFKVPTQMLWHDGVGYWILNGKGVLSGETREARWTEFDRYNKKIKNLPKTAPILTFQIEHGKNVKNGSYAYAVDFHCPDFTALTKLVEKAPFEIVSATSDAHVVQDRSTGTLAGVFFHPGKAGKLSVDAPAVVLVRQASNGVQVTVNDPEQNPKLDSIMLGWEGKNYKIQLPSGSFCGQPVTVNLSKLKALNE